MLHHYVSTVARKGQPKHSFQRGPFAFLAASGVSLLRFVDELPGAPNPTHWPFNLYH